MAQSANCYISSRASRSTKESDNHASFATRYGCPSIFLTRHVFPLPFQSANCIRAIIAVVVWASQPTRIEGDKKESSDISSTSAGGRVSLRASIKLNPAALCEYKREQGRKNWLISLLLHRASVIMKALPSHSTTSTHEYGSNFVQQFHCRTYEDLAELSRRINL